MLERNRITVLHYAKVTPDMNDGVSLAVKNIVFYQSFYAKVILFNYLNNSISYYENGSLVLEKEKQKSVLPIDEADIVLLHSMFDIPKSVLITKRIIKSNKPFILVPHGCLSKEAINKKRTKKLLALKLFYRKQIRKSYAIQYLSDGERDSSVIKGKRILVLPNGIARSSEKIIVPKANKRIVFLGRKDVYHKGIDLLLDAISIVKNDLIANRAKVYFYGTDHDNGNKLIDNVIAKEQLTDVVENCKPVFGKEKEDVFFESDAFVLTSRYEGQPTTILEAMSFGLPVIVSRGTNFVPEVSKYNCGLVCENNSNSIADALKVFVRTDHDSMRNWSSNSIKLVSDKYNWKKVEFNAIEEYKRIIGE